MIIVIPILQMKESRFKVVKNLLGISSGGRVGFKSTPFWLQILFLAIVHLSHIDMSPNHIALKSIYMINESHIYISNIDLPLSSKLGYPTACRYLRSNLPQSELQTAFSLHRCAHAQSSPLSVSLFPFSYSGQSVVVALDASFSFTAHMQVTGKSNGTNNVRNPNHLFPPPWSLPFYCLFSAQLSGWLSLCHSPVQKFLVLSCPMHGVSIIVIAFQLETHPSILDFILLGQLAPIWARPVEGDRGRWHHWRRERELLLPVLFSVGSPSACSSCEWHPSPASSPWQWQFLPEAAVKSTLQLFPYSRTYLIVLPHGHQIQLPLPPIVAWTLAPWNPPSSEFPNFNSLLFVTLEIASYRSF